MILTCAQLFLYSHVQNQKIFAGGGLRDNSFFFFTGPQALFSVFLLCEIIKFEFFQICACCISLISIFFFFFLHLHRAKNSMMDPQSGNDRQAKHGICIFLFFSADCRNLGIRGCKLCFKMFWSSSVLRISKYVYKCRYDYFNNQRVQGNLS